MALAASLFLRQTQSLVMTPQLMQSIQLLQMTHLELTHFIEQEVEKNPLLEVVANDDMPREIETIADEGYPSVHEERNARDSAGSPREQDVYDSATSGTTGSMSDTFDANLEDVFPDDAGPRQADAPELIGQWKSMPGGESGESYDLDDFVAGQITLRISADEAARLLMIVWEGMTVRGAIGGLDSDRLRRTASDALGRMVEMIRG